MLGPKKDKYKVCSLLDKAHPKFWVQAAEDSQFCQAPRCQKRCKGLAWHYNNIDTIVLSTRFSDVWKYNQLRIFGDIGKDNFKVQEILVFQLCTLLWKTFSFVYPYGKTESCYFYDFSCVHFVLSGQYVSNQIRVQSLTKCNKYCFQIVIKR